MGSIYQKVRVRQLPATRCPGCSFVEIRRFNGPTRCTFCGYSYEVVGIADEQDAEYRSNPVQSEDLPIGGLRE